MESQTEVFKPDWEIFPQNWRTILAQNIRLERKRLNISQVELSGKMGYGDGGTVSNWERGKGFNIDTLVMLGEFFKRKPNELLIENLSGVSPPPQKAPLILERDDGGERGGGEASSPAAAESPPAALAAEMKALEKTVFDAVLKMGELREAVGKTDRVE